MRADPVYCLMLRNPRDDLRRVPLWHTPTACLVDQARDPTEALALLNFYNGRGPLPAAVLLTNTPQSASCGHGTTNT